MKHGFQFQLNGVGCGPIRGSWTAAVGDAIQAGCAVMLAPRVILTFGNARVKRLNIRPVQL